MRCQDETCDRIEKIVLPAIGLNKVADVDWDDTVDATDPDSVETTAALELLDDFDDERRLSFIKLDSAQEPRTSCF